MAPTGHHLRCHAVGGRRHQRPDCSAIYCEVHSNKDQLEIELLPCGGGISIENRDLEGKVLYWDVFTSSRVATAHIGGEYVQLNVTIIQRGVTVGFAVSGEN